MSTFYTAESNSTYNFIMQYQSFSILKKDKWNQKSSRSRGYTWPFQNNITTFTNKISSQKIHFILEVCPVQDEIFRQ